MSWNAGKFPQRLISVGSTGTHSCTVKVLRSRGISAQPWNQTCWEKEKLKKKNLTSTHKRWVVIATIWAARVFSACVCVRRCTATDWFLSRVRLPRPPRRPPHAHNAVNRPVPTTRLPLGGSINKVSTASSSISSWRSSRRSPLIAFSVYRSPEGASAKFTKGVLCGVTCRFDLSRKCYFCLFVDTRAVVPHCWVVSFQLRTWLIKFN